MSDNLRITAPLKQSDWSSSLRRLLVFFILFGTIATSLVLWQAREITGNLEILRKDTGLYVKMGQGGKIEDNIVPYRSLVPYLAGKLPDPPKWLFSKNSIGLYQERNQEIIKFGMINLVFLIATGIMYYFIVRNFGLTHAQGVLGGLLFFSLMGVVTYGTIPLVDPGYWFFLSLGVFALQRQNVWLLIITFIFGLLDKELMVFLVPYILLMPIPWSRRFRLLACALPGLIIFLLRRAYFAPANGDMLSFTMFQSVFIPRILGKHIDFRRIVKLFLAFNFLWIPCCYACFKCRRTRLLARWSYIIPIFIILFGLLDLNYYRHLIVAAPVVIPLALLGLDDWYPLNGLAQAKGDI
jgi:hypothetical protein